MMDVAVRPAAIEDIKTLKARYLRHLDDQNWALFGDTLTPVVDFDHPTIGTHRTAEDTVEAVRSRLSGSLTVHQANVPEIDVHDDVTASGTWSLHSVVIPRQGDDRTSHVREAWSRYHERYRHEAGVWRIASLELVYLHRLGSPS